MVLLLHTLNVTSFEKTSVIDQNIIWRYDRKQTALNYSGNHRFITLKATQMSYLPSDTFSKS